MDDLAGRGSRATAPPLPPLDVSISPLRREIARMFEALYQGASWVAGTLVLALAAGIVRSAGDNLARRMGWDSAIAGALQHVPTHFQQLLRCLPDIQRLRRWWWFWLILGASVATWFVLGFVTTRIE